MKLSEVARIMYEIQERCKGMYFCDGCFAYDGKKCRLRAMEYKVPATYDIIPEDIERLERDGK